MSETTTTAAETEKDFGGPPAGVAARWLAEIDAYEKEFQPWNTRCDKITERYLSEGRVDTDARRFALLWSNIEVLKPTLYARDPKPAVTRRFRDKDVVARVGATLLERCLLTLLDRGQGSFGRAMRSLVLDRLLGSRGVARVRYVPVIRDEQVLDEDVTVDFVHRRDFGHSAGARTWDEVGAVWFKAYMTRDELRARFGDDVGNRVPLNCKRPGTTEDDGAKEVFSKAEVYEIWEHAPRRCYWIVKGMQEPLDARPYPLKLVSRFPCPAPTYGTVGNGTLIPVPDYVFYQDQAEELDTLTARIAKLTEACRLVGFIPAQNAPDVQIGLDSDREVSVVPVQEWVMGGNGNSIVWLPIGEVAACLQRLTEARDKVKQDAWEVTGLSDILRGQTNASETATAQQIKAQWGGIRVRESQQDVARAAASLLTLMAEVVCGHFMPERIASLGYMQGIQEAMAPSEPPQPPMPGMMPPPPPPTVGDLALQLLKGPEALLHSRVDVESDSTIAPDEAAEREATTEMLGAVSSVLQNALPVMQPMAQASPQAASAFANLVGALMGQALRTVRKAEAVEAAAEQFTEALAQAVSQPPPPPAPPPPNPADEAKAQSEQQRTELDAQRLQFDAAKAQDDSRHRDEDRQIQMAQIKLEALRPETAVVQ